MARLPTRRAHVHRRRRLRRGEEISAIKVVAPNIALRIIDEAMQIHGGAGLSGDFPLAAMYAAARILRLADGPDEVHRGLVARWELLPHKDRIAPSRPRN